MNNLVVFTTFTVCACNTCNGHLHLSVQFQKFHHSKKKPHIQLSPGFLNSWQSPAFCLWIHLFWILHRNGVMYCVTFCIMYHASFTQHDAFHCSMSLLHSFLWLNNTRMYILQFAYPFVDRHLGGFYLLAVVNSAAVNMRIHVFV